MGLEDKRSVFKRKKYQRAVNKLIRNINDDIQQDWLWNGRFVVYQRASYFYPYPDKSGAEFTVILECIDSKTNQSCICNFNNYGFEYKLFQWVNSCITDRFKVWQEDPNPWTQACEEGRSPLE